MKLRCTNDVSSGDENGDRAEESGGSSKVGGIKVVGDLSVQNEEELTAQGEWAGRTFIPSRGVRARVLRCRNWFKFPKLGSHHCGAQKVKTLHHPWLINFPFPAFNAL